MDPKHMYQIFALIFHVPTRPRSWTPQVLRRTTQFAICGGALRSGKQEFKLTGYKKLKNDVPVYRTLSEWELHVLDLQVWCHREPFLCWFNWFWWAFSTMHDKGLSKIILHTHIAIHFTSWSKAMNYFTIKLAKKWHQITSCETAPAYIYTTSHTYTYSDYG